MLLALVRDGKGVAAEVLMEAGVTESAARATLAKLRG
jgi:hypothetical protein